MLMELRPEESVSDSFRRAALVLVILEATVTVSVDATAGEILVTHFYVSESANAVDRIHQQCCWLNIYHLNGGINIFLFHINYFLS